MIVKQFESLSFISVKNMLLRLQNYNGLFYLSQNESLTIGLMPKIQWISSSPSQFTETLRSDPDITKTYRNKNLASHLNQHWQTIQHTNDLGSSLQNNFYSAGFCGGILGLITYDFAALQHIKLNHLPQIPTLFGEYDIFFRLENNRWILYGPEDLALESVYTEIKHSITITDFAHSPLKVISPFQACWSFQQYLKAFNQVQHYLKSGDCYQVNLAQTFKAKADGKLLNTLDSLLDLTKASYAAYTSVGNFELLSCSPELFIEFKANHLISTKPIKGTRPRRDNDTLDLEQKQQLSNSEKDRSENLMIVDLLRNDLGKYAQTGSVKVTSLFNIESFAQVHHMVSEIQATLKPEISPLQILFDALPGGSITGAPKIRAMQIIDELEYEARGAYCGSVGYLNYDNTGSFNILIRTLQKQGDTMTAWAGGGITIASECQAEYQECFDKIEAILDCVNHYAEED